MSQQQDILKIDSELSGGNGKRKAQEPCKGHIVDTWYQKKSKND